MSKFLPFIHVMNQLRNHKHFAMVMAFEQDDQLLVNVMVEDLDVRELIATFLWQVIKSKDVVSYEKEMDEVLKYIKQRVLKLKQDEENHTGKSNNEPDDRPTPPEGVHG